VALPRIRQLALSFRPKDENQARALKRCLRISGITLGVLVLILIVLPFLIDVNRYWPKLESAASAAVGRQVTVGALSLSIFTGSVDA